ncbi:hypothetical protein GQ457_10G011520 [Hibiscus cannabinus]
MAGSQSLVAYKNSSTGTAQVHTYRVASYGSIVPKDLSFEVWDKTVESLRDGMGPSIGDDGSLAKHDFAPANLQAKGTLDLKSGQSATGSGGNDKLKKKNVNSWDSKCCELGNFVSTRGNDPATHKPKADALSSSTSNLRHMAQWERARLEAEANLVRESRRQWRLLVSKKTTITGTTSLI